MVKKSPRLFSPEAHTIFHSGLICSKSHFLFDDTLKAQAALFAGITDKIFMDDNGDRDTSYAILDMDPVTGEFFVS